MTFPTGNRAPSLKRIPSPLAQFDKPNPALSQANILVSLMRYPRIVQDSQYLYDKLKPVLAGIDYREFRSVFEKAVRPEWVYRLSRKDD